MPASRTPSKFSPQQQLITAQSEFVPSTAINEFNPAPHTASPTSSQNPTHSPLT